MISTSTSTSTWMVAGHIISILIWLHHIKIPIDILTSVCFSLTCVTYGMYYRQSNPFPVSNFYSCPLHSHVFIDNLCMLSLILIFCNLTRCRDLTETDPIYFKFNSTQTPLKFLFKIQDNSEMMSVIVTRIASMTSSIFIYFHYDHIYSQFRKLGR